ncbi:hypothetical protein [Streptomyces yunnanensis]|uniref:hypothetical protein n=1 Tax=Streptomyces yunnanensis TaxID=156453 RepID=UPI00142DE554|nr:hypothetical protein [Streptomyces yunnanensis]
MAIATCGYLALLASTVLGGPALGSPPVPQPTPHHPTARPTAPEGHHADGACRDSGGSVHAHSSDQYHRAPASSQGPRARCDRQTPDVTPKALP